MNSEWRKGEIIYCSCGWHTGFHVDFVQSAQEADWDWMSATPAAKSKVISEDSGYSNSVKYHETHFMWPRCPVCGCETTEWRGWGDLNALLPGKYRNRKVPKKFLKEINQMNKPAGYDDININVADKPTVGGHKCIIVKVVEQKSSTGKEQLEIWLDMAGDDIQPMLFSNQFMNNTNENKKWPCRFWITSYETEDFGKRSLKRFVTAAEDSNANFFVQWGATFEACLKGKRIGVVFGEEENEWNGRISTLVKPRYFCDVTKAQEQDIPEKKALKPETAAFQPAPGVNGQEGFLQVPDGLEDAGLPFM